MESEYRSSYGSFYNQQSTNSISDTFQKKYLEKVENDHNLKEINKQESNLEQKYDPEYLVDRYYKIHPEKDKVGFRKYYDKVKRSKTPERTTYNEFFNKRGAYLPKFSDYVEAINNMANIVETNDAERKILFSKRIKKEEDLGKLQSATVEQDKKMKEESKPTKEKDEDEVDYTPLELSMLAINNLRKKGYYQKYSPRNVLTSRGPKTFY